jgi:diadenosine tetraphosphate (Ap4A) HIT family hydrolase
MAVIYETNFYVIQSADYPLVDRNDGGHITIDPKFKVSTRQQLTTKQAIELMMLTIIVGEAMTTVMMRHGVDIGRINYQDNGNWAVFNPEGPQLHYHLYGRARSAVYQPFGQTLHFPHKEEMPSFYERNKPLTKEDVIGIRSDIETIIASGKYAYWGTEI